MPPATDPATLLAETGLWAYLIIAVVLLAEAVPIIGAAIPAQLFMLGAGFLAGAQRAGGDPHRLHASLIILVGFVSLYAADIFSFHLGRKYGLSMLDRLPRTLARRARDLSDKLGAHAGKTLVLGKFLGPARALTPPMAGAGGVSWPRFLVYEAIGSLVWVTVMVVLGSIFGHSYHAIEKVLGRGAIVLVLALVVAYLTWMRLRVARTDERIEETHTRP